ncbi:argininosuccinate synthase [Engelhardtia mirabilis]|uniref:Argininosuccinate synthase n=1 Tax=Engelhardtia mirabilis TaxID=2528011 RepID=A0A518BQ04_9BACT|nr:Argininosuccinate synthase [Planctomycetes bacterium Pla133]QDV03379.1 Argininosuccinate synthase [Planctomycetes bacterium Pla86]
MDKLVLAYSGGLDTSIAIPWLREHYGVEVHAICGDVGQGEEELVGLEEKALASGAASARVVDLRERFVTHCVWPALRALATYEGRYLLGTSLARPVLAEAQVAFAKELGARYVSHGCTGKGNDQVRFELGFMTLGPELEIIAPWREWEIESREDAIDYAEKAGIPITASRTKIYSRDRNLWHISHEGGSLEDPGTAPPDDVWTWTVDPRQAPDAPQRVMIDFEAGVPVGAFGGQLGPVALIERLNAVGAAHGVGRVDIVENRLVGMKSRGVYETPGGTILYEALRSLRALTMERDLSRTCERLALEYADVVYTGRWFHPLRESLDAFFTAANRDVSGSVTVELYKGRATTVACTSTKSLYSEDLATFGVGTGYDRVDSKGFVRLYGLPGQVAARVHGTDSELDTVRS